jgi:signal transduction histidine kinase
MLDRIFGIGPEYEHTVDGWGRLLHPGRSSGDARLRPAGDRRAHGHSTGNTGSCDPAMAPCAGCMASVRSSAPGRDAFAPGRHGAGHHRAQAAEEATQALLDENTRLVRQLIAVQERERAELARELHDELSQHLTAIRAFAGAIRRNGVADGERIKAAAQAIDDCAQRDLHRCRTG